MRLNGHAAAPDRFALEARQDRIIVCAGAVGRGGKVAEPELGVELHRVVVKGPGLHDAAVEQPVGLWGYQMGFDQRGPSTLAKDCDCKRERGKEGGGGSQEQSRDGNGL